MIIRIPECCSLKQKNLKLNVPTGFDHAQLWKLITFDTSHFSFEKPDLKQYKKVYKSSYKDSYKLELFTN